MYEMETKRVINQVRKNTGVWVFLGFAVYIIPAVRIQT